MKRYRRLLIQLGEKRQWGGGSGWPVEVRIVMMMLFNAVILLLVNTFASWISPGLIAEVQEYIVQFISGERGVPPGHVEEGSKTRLPLPPPDPESDGYDFEPMVKVASSFIGNPKAAEAPPQQQQEKPKPRLRRPKV
jgi:hypothetical protein